MYGKKKFKKKKNKLSLLNEKPKLNSNQISKTKKEKTDQTRKKIQSPTLTPRKRSIENSVGKFQKKKKNLNFRNKSVNLKMVNKKKKKRKKKKFVLNLNIDVNNKIYNANKSDYMNNNLIMMPNRKDKFSKGIIKNPRTKRRRNVPRSRLNKSV